MSKKQILDFSEKVLRSQVSYFDGLQKTDVTINSSTLETILSFYPIEKENTIQFQFSSSPSQYVDLRGSTIFVDCKIVKADGTNLTSEDSVSSANLLLHSLFKDVEITLNSDIIYSSNDTYPYRAYIQNHLGMGLARKQSELTSALYYQDTTKTIDFEKDGGLKTRKEFIAGSKNIELESALCVDLCQQIRYIPPQTNIVVKLKRASPEFVLITKPSAKEATSTTASVTPYRIILQQCKLKVLSHTLNEPYHEQIEHSLSSGKVGRIQMKRTELKTHFITPNVFSVVADRLFLGTIPEVIIIGILPALAYNGSLSTNPFCFENNGVSSVTVTTDTGAGIVNQVISIDEEGNRFLEAYRSILNLVSLDSANGISRDMYLNGNCLYGFFTLPRSLQSTVQTVQQGSVKITVNFKTQVTQPLVLLAYSQNDVVLSFDQDKNFKFL